MPKKQSKKKNKRTNSRYPALSKRLNLKSRQEQQSDFDYIDGFYDESTGETMRALTASEKRFLNNFIEEEINANLKHPGKKLNIKKEDQKRIYTNNNARNRCILSRAKARGRALGIDDLHENFTMDQTIEDDLIEQIDMKRLIPDEE